MDNNSHEEGYPSLWDIAMLIASAEFPLGTIAATGNLMDLIHVEDAFRALKRHSQKDWGNVSEEDKTSNDLALEEGTRLLSVYKDRHGETFWIITEADRSVTTILMPEDY